MKPIFIVLPGPSVENLKNHIVDVNDIYPDAIWASMNHYKILEDSILSKVEKKFEVLGYLDPHILNHYMAEIHEFLDRESNSIFISDYDTIEDIEKLGGLRVRNLQGSVVYSSYSRGKNPKVSDKFYNTLTAMLLTLIGLGHREFVLFGADGAGPYFGEENNSDRDGIPVNEIQRRLSEDTKFMNEYFWKLKNEITPEHVAIANCSGDSHLTCFDKVSISEIL